MNLGTIAMMKTYIFKKSSSSSYEVKNARKSLFTRMCAHDFHLGIVCILVLFSLPEIKLNLDFMVIYRRTSDLYCVLKISSDVISK